ncbi:MAG: sigma-54-dependent Fis family transcriptional regulator [Myxococcales bacterium]|nr:sigma-54-dependent Fis family transcriptional regulator [Myxococcales bacterium]
MAIILIIDDNETIREGLGQVVRKLGHTAHLAPSGTAGLALLRKHGADFVITDLKMDGLDGVEVLRQVHEHDPDLPAMIITAFGTVDTAVEAMKIGAFDFLQKPFPPEVVRLKVERALEFRAARLLATRLNAENEYLRTNDAQAFGELVGSTDEMRRVFTTIERVAPTDASVAIYGESGTGKELVARAIHTCSKRADRPFIKVNCGAIVDTLLESELFGHEKGSFTGAIKRKLGRFELADTGTLFLDEVGDVSPAMQLKLLRVLQEREFERVGGESTVKVDVRMLSATNKDLAREVAEGRFREDLYYRLQVVPITVPPLRDRKGDLAPLIHHFIRKLAPRTNAAVTGIDGPALARLHAYHWPGNVRELENVIEQSLVFAEGDRITPLALPMFLKGESVARSERVASGERSLPEILDELERELILKAYEKAKGVKTETARLLGVKTSALYYKLEKYGIT